MKNYLNLVKTMLIMRYRLPKNDSSNKKRTYTLVGFAILYFVLMAFFTVPVVMLGKVATQFNIVTEMLTIIQLFGIGLVLIFGLIAFLNTMYFNKDAQFLATLPVKTSTVFLAKFTIIYIGEVITTAAVIFIPMLAAGIAAGLGFGFYVAAVLSLFVIPAIPMLIACLLAVPLMYIASFFKNRGVIGTIMLLIVFAGLMGGYMYLMINMGMNSENEDNALSLAEMIKNLASSIQTIGYVILPSYALSCLATGAGIFGVMGAGAVAIELACALLIPVILCGLSAAFSSLFYRRAVLAQQENRKRAQKKSGAYSAKSPIRALLSADIKNIARSPAFAINIFMGVILAPLMVVMFGMIFRTQFTTDGMGSEEIIGMSSAITRFIIFTIIYMLCAGINTAAMCGFSRDGGALIVMRTMPIKANEIVKAKLIVAMIVALSGMLLSVIVSLFLTEIDIGFVLPFVVFAGFSSYFTACFFLKSDLKSPQLKWSSPGQIFKRSGKNVLTTYVIMFVSVMLSFIGFSSVILVPLFSPESAILTKSLVWIFLIGISVGLALWQHFSLFKRAQEYWDKIEQHN